MNAIHNILKDPECAGNIRCFVWATVVVCLYFGGMCAGFAMLDVSSHNHEHKHNNKHEHDVIQVIDQYNFTTEIEELKSRTNTIADQSIKHETYINKHKEKIHYGS